MNDQSQGVPAFLSKLWALVEDPASDYMICWDASGRSFHVLDQGSLAREELPRYFKHSNIASFVRQLNMYGFRKKMHIEAGGLKVEKEDMEFQHPYFVRDHSELLEHIKRKVASSSKPEEVKVNHDEVSRVLGDVKHIRGRQDNLTSKLDVLQRENEALWREVANLRQKHNKQQQVVNKLIQFLLSLVSAKRPAMPGKRRLPMLNDSTQLSSPKIPRLSCQGSVGQEYNGATQTGIGPNGTNLLQSTGPTIHDVTDLPGQAIPTQGSPTIPEVTEPPSIDNLIPLDDKVTIEDIVNMGNPIKPEEGLVSFPNIVENPAPQSNIVKLETPQTVKLKPPVSKPSNRPLAPLVIPQNNQLNLEELVDMQGSIDSQNVVMNLLGGPRSPSRGEVVDDLKFLDTDLDSIKQLLSTGSLNLDPSILSGLFTPEAPLPATPDHFLQMDKVPLPTAAAPATQPVPGASIVGNELMHYNPQDDQDNILTLFDLGDVSNDSVTQPVLNTMPTTLLEDDQDGSNGYVNLETPSLLIDDSNKITTEDID